MSVAVDNTGASAGGTAVTSLTIVNFVVGAGSNRFLFVGVSQYKNPDASPSSVTFNGTACTSVDSVTVLESPGTRRLQVYQQIAPANVTANLVANWATAVDEAVVGASSWTGVEQTTPLGTAVKNSGSGVNNSSISVASSSGNVVHDALSVDAVNGATLSTGTQTAMWRQQAAILTTEGDGQSAAGATSVTMQWTFANGNSFFDHMGFDIKQSASAVKQLAALGVG